jgi:hypothetical protein
LNARASLRVQRLHEVDLDSERARPDREDVLVDVLPLALRRPDGGQPEDVDPESAKLLLVESPDRDLLNPENAKGARVRHDLPSGL